MLAHHTFFELRTSRDAEQTPAAAAHLFATLPHLKNKFWHALLGPKERVSFEIVVVGQMVYFTCSVPTRLREYFKGSITASYPEILITELSSDPVETFNSTTKTEGYFWSIGQLKLRHASYLPLKTYQEFSEMDPLSTLLSTLANSEPHDVLVIQCSVADTGEGWKNAGYSLLQNQTAQTPSSYKGLIERKINQRGLRTVITVGAAAVTKERTELLLETISATFQAMTQSEGNSFVLKKPLLFRHGMLQQLMDRKFNILGNQYLSLDELATLYHLPNKSVTSIPNIAWGKTLSGEPPENLPIITRDTDPEIKKDINVFAQTLYKNTPSIYGLKRGDRRRHMYVIGKTGTGKSTLLANMAINDLKNDEGMCIIDPHGDLVENLLNYIPSRRINDVVYFDPSDPERTVKINLFEGENVVHRELIASGIVSIFQKLYAYSWGPRLEYILRNALLTLLKSPQAKLSDITDLLTNYDFRQKIVAELDDPILKNFWVFEFDKMQDRQRNEAVAPILNKVGQFVSSPMIRNVVNAPKSSFSIEDIMDNGKILLVNLSQGRLGEDNATLLGAMMITKIQLAAMSRVHIPEEQRRDFYLYVDEFQNFATESFVKILSEARKYRLNLILANQYIAQIPEEVQKAIFGNCGSMASFVMGADDASYFVREYGDKYSQDDLVSLSRHQIINKLAIDNIISHPFPATTLPLAKSRNSNKDKVMRVSRERWATKKI
ncbi:MAG: type IV secretion system DNA-binding domain-containing protein [bacterium]|nr:type IV secretion system DNA-binding domain-containing protein [bacterium]